MGRNLTEIASLLIGVATLALLVGNADGAAKVIKAGAGSFAGLLGVVTLQSQYSNVWN